MFMKNVLNKKRASVWGTGYLGYTIMLKLQEYGFKIFAYELNRFQRELFRKGNYPAKEQAISWSAMNYLPKLDCAQIKLADDPRELFRDVYLHIIATPEAHKNISERNIAGDLAEIFSVNLKKKGAVKPLIVLESAATPGHIEKFFVERLKAEGLNCGRDYYLGVLFRTDWSVEAFLKQEDFMPIAGYCRISLEAMRQLCGYFSLPCVELGTIKEAEIYVNSMHALQSMANDFARQLAVGYPSVNIKRVSKALFKNIRLHSCALDMGSGGVRTTFAIDNLIHGSACPQDLTLLKDFQDINISSVLDYGEYIIRHSYKSVGILGLTYGGNQKDVMFSPSITLADYLISNSVEVLLDDPFCTKNEINKLVKNAKVSDFPEGIFSTEVLVLAAGHRRYRQLSQAVFDRIKKKTKLIIDNYGIWSSLSFGDKVKYHCVGDGTLDLTK